MEIGNFDNQRNAELTKIYSGLSPDSAALRFSAR
jgi:hypothetical protein